MALTKNDIIFIYKNYNKSDTEIYNYFKKNNINVTLNSIVRIKYNIKILKLNQSKSYNEIYKNLKNTKYGIRKQNFYIITGLFTNIYYHYIPNKQVCYKHNNLLSILKKHLKKSIKGDHFLNKKLKYNFKIVALYYAMQSNSDIIDLFNNVYTAMSLIDIRNDIRLILQNFYENDGLIGIYVIYNVKLKKFIR